MREVRKPDKADAPRTASQAAIALRYMAVGAVLMGYFAWICVQMAGRAGGGIGLVIAIFAAELAGVLAILAGVLLGGRRRVTRIETAQDRQRDSRSASDRQARPGTRADRYGEGVTQSQGQQPARSHTASRRQPERVRGTYEVTQGLRR